MSWVSLFGHDPASYEPHPLHRSDASYPETNCYTDIIIELLHARGDEPLALLGFTVAVDFEGDQWTFFKPPPEALERLYGIDVHEMQPYRPLPEQIVQQLEAGRTIIVELDAFHLPDTAATSYAREHVKTSVVIEALDEESQRLRYFHNGSLYELAGEDYTAALRLEALPPDALPPYAELVRFDAGPRLAGEELRAPAREILRAQLGRAPRSNPFTRFGESLERELPRLLAGDAADYHAYAFATVRMAGSAFELCAAHLAWLYGEAADPAVAAFREIGGMCKTLSFKLARRRPFDTGPAALELATSWDAGLAAVADLAR